MPLRTSVFGQFPWFGGLNTSLDESTIPNNELVLADNIIFSTTQSKKKREGIDYDWDSGTSSSSSIIGLKDFWFYDSGKFQQRISVTNDTAAVVYKYTSTGTRTQIPVDTAGTTITSPTKVSFEAISNLLIIATDGATNVLKKYSGSGNVEDLGGTPPPGAILRAHQGRLWTNDKTDPDRLHYSTTFNPEEWNGTGDSGAIDIGQGDDDPEGITAIFPTYRGELFVAKKTKLYRVSGDNPENYKVTLVTDGLGCVSHNSVDAIDSDDIFYVSERGVHSLRATIDFGDVSSVYISQKIQKTFNDDWSKSRQDRIIGKYIPEQNLYMLAVTDTTESSNINKALWIYNLADPGQPVTAGAWFTWKGVECEALELFRDSDQQRPYVGSSTERVGKTFDGTDTDTTESGSSTGIIMGIKTGRIFPDGNVYTVSAFKRFGLIYKPSGTHTVTVKFKIDDYPTQTLIFSATNPGDVLGSTFILGSSQLGVTFPLAPSALTIDGYGRGFTVEITQSGTSEDLEIQGFTVEYEGAGTKQETTLTANTGEPV